MTDFAIHLDAENAAIALFGGQLVMDESLRPAVLMSLFVDREVPGLHDGERRGWWGDALATDADDRTGSVLWTLQRERIRPDTPGRVKAACEQCLAWLVADGVARKVVATAQLRGADRVDVEIAIHRTNGQRELVRFALTWAATLGRHVLEQNRDQALGEASINALLEFEFFNHYPGILNNG